MTNGIGLISLLKLKCATRDGLLPKPIDLPMYATAHIRVGGAAQHEIIINNACLEDPAVLERIIDELHQVIGGNVSRLHLAYAEGSFEGEVEKHCPQ